MDGWEVCAVKLCHAVLDQYFSINIVTMLAEYSVVISLNFKFV